MGLMHTPFHFLHPLWLLALPVTVALLAWWRRPAAREAGWSRAIDAPLLKVLTLGEPGSARSPWWILGLFWASVIIALAGPAWTRTPTPSYRSPAGWVLLVDLSPSMAGKEVVPDRATRARYAATDLINAAHGARIGLIAYAGEAHVVAPLTSDTATVETLLRPLSPTLMPEDGDRLAPALSEAGQLMQGAAVNRGQIIVLSDGMSDPAAAFSAAENLRAQGMKISIVGIGSDTDQQDALRRVAMAGGGDYVTLSELPRLLDGLKPDATPSFDATLKMGPGELAQWRNEGIWLLPVILLLAALLARRGWI